MRVFLPQRWLLPTVLAGALLFVCMTAIFIWLPLANPDGSFPDPRTAAAIGGFVFGGFTLLSIYSARGLHGLRLLTSSPSVRLVSAARDCSIAFAELTRTQWRCRPAGGSLVLQTRSSRLVIEFSTYAERRDLIAYFRRSLPPAVQEGYDRFDAAYGIPRSPVVISDRMTLILAVTSLLVAAAYWVMRDVAWIRMTGGFVLLFSVAIAATAMLDFVRQPRRHRLFATVVSAAAVACLVAAFWPTVRFLAQLSH